MFTKILIRAVVCAAFVLVLGSCFEPWDDNTGTVIINMDASRSAQRQGDNENDIKYKITFSGKSGKIELKAEGGKIIKTTLVAGIWNIEIEASLNGRLYRGSDVVEVKAGQTVHKDDIVLRYVEGTSGATVINIKAIPGVTAPVTDAIPVTVIGENEQYTGDVTWKNAEGVALSGNFAASTVYTATITLTAKAGYTLQGVAANFFTVADATSVSYAADSGIVTAVFPTTAGTVEQPAVIDIKDIPGVTAPSFGQTPVANITDTAQYTGTVMWKNEEGDALSGDFAASTVYTAAITLTAKPGYTLQGVAADFFKVDGAESVSNQIDSGEVKAVFPKTVSIVNIINITGIAPAAGGTPVASIAANDQYTGTVEWSPAVYGTFASITPYTATITINVKTGFTLQGVAEDFFKVDGAESAVLNANVITAEFPATGAFTTIPAMATWLAAQPANTAAAAYAIALNVSNLGGNSNANGSAGYTLRQNSTKYVSLDLSGSTFTTIGTGAFYDCTSLVSVTIPNTVTAIDDGAFNGCSGLTGVIIGNNVKTIGYQAFYNCTSLASVTIPNSVTSIGSYAFNSCNKLESLTFTPTSQVTSIGSNAFYNCANLKSITIPDSVKTIEAYAFYSCSKLESIIIPNSVTGSIGTSAFYNCTNLESVTIGNSVTTIGSFAFGYCSKLESVTFIPASQVTSIGDRAFQYCTILDGITIPNSVTSIGRYAFERCTGLTSVIIGNNVDRIEDNAFSGCSKLGGITIPNSVTTIGTSAFYDCANLESVTFTPDSKVTGIGVGAFQNCTILDGITIPNSVITIGQQAFSGCSKLGGITIPNSVTTIGQQAFSGCSDIVSVTLPINENFTAIANNTFYNCKKLTDVTIPNSVTTIGQQAFYGCANLESVMFTATSIVTTIGDYAFQNCTSLTGIIIPNSVTRIPSSAFSGCSKLESVTLPTNANFTTIGMSAFNGCANLTGVTIPNSVTTIGAYAFYGCSKLKNITIPDSVTTIADYSFQYCTSLASVTIGNGVTSIADRAFYNCTSLVSVTFENTITSSGFSTSAFYPIGDLRAKFYATDADNGTPGTYTTPPPVSSSSVWTKEP
jgi:hypothetical protein